MLGDGNRAALGRFLVGYFRRGRRGLSGLRPTVVLFGLFFEEFGPRIFRTGLSLFRRLPTKARTATLLPTLFLRIVRSGAERLIQSRATTTPRRGGRGRGFSSRSARWRRCSSSCSRSTLESASIIGSVMEERPERPVAGVFPPGASSSSKINRPICTRSPGANKIFLVGLPLTRVGLVLLLCTSWKPPLRGFQLRVAWLRETVGSLKSSSPAAGRWPCEARPRISSFPSNLITRSRRSRWPSITRSCRPELHDIVLELSQPSGGHPSYWVGASILSSE